MSWGRGLPGGENITRKGPEAENPAHRQEGEVPELAVHGLAGDPVPGPQTPCHPDPRQPGECAHLLLPVTLGAAVPAQS